MTDPAPIAQPVGSAATPATEEPVAPPDGPEGPSRTRQRSLPHRVLAQVFTFLRASPAGAVGMLIILLWVAVALLAPVLAPHPPTRVFGEAILSAPDSRFWFGTDSNGMDIFSRTLHAARLDLLIAGTAVTVSLVLGVALGLLSGYVGGWVDMVMLRVMDVLQAFPALILALAIVAALQQGLTSVIFVIAFLDTPIYTRLIRADSMKVSSRMRRVSARALGNPTWRILALHVLPNALPPVVIQSAVRMAWAIKITASLAFVGVGIQVPTPEWGSMIRVGADGIMAGRWWPTVFPGLAVVSLVLGLNLLADGLQRFLRPGGR
jgi:peptide/nickel transport system permease protein